MPGNEPGDTLQITAGHFVAGIVLDPITDRAVKVAPIVGYMIDWPRRRIVHYCRGKRWQVEECGL
jgi:hypothetical protein